MPSTEWYFSRNNLQEGPVPFESLVAMGRQGVLQPTHLVWTPGMADWQPAGQISGIFAAPAPPTPAPISQAPSPQPAIYARPHAPQSYAPQAYAPYPQLIPMEYAAQPVDPSIRYGGFWIRVVASFVDGLILSVFAIIVFIVMAVASHQDFSSSDWNGPNPSDEAVGFVILWLMIVAFVAMLFNVILESSALQGTPGKKLFGLRVTDLTGQRISFGRALGRNLSKNFLSGICFIGFILVGVSERKQGLHDLIAGTLVRRKP